MTGQGYHLVDRGYVYLKVAAGPASQSSDTALEQGVSCHKAGDYLCALRRFKEACQAGAAEGCLTSESCSTTVTVSTGSGPSAGLLRSLCQLGSAKGGANLGRPSQWYARGQCVGVWCARGNPAGRGKSATIPFPTPVEPWSSAGLQRLCSGKRRVMQNRAPHGDAVPERAAGSG